MVKTIVALVSLLLAAPAYAQTVAWTYLPEGVVQLTNSSRRTATYTLNTYIGDQTACGSTLSCYYHGASAPQTIPANTSVMVPFNVWLNVYDGSGQDNWQAFYVVIQSNVALTCNGSSYETTEHNPGPSAATGQGNASMWMSHQGGSETAPKSCNTASIAANKPTQVVSDNAGSYNPNGGPLTLSMAGMPLSNRMVLQVADTPEASPTSDAPTSPQMQNKPSIPELDFNPCAESQHPVDPKGHDACPSTPVPSK